MADPTIQAFCEVNYESNDRTVLLIKGFNSTAYNAVSLFSSTVGILGALYQILPRKEYTRNHRWLSFSAARGRRIIFWLSIADLFASLGVLVRAAVWINNRSLMLPLTNEWNLNFCTISSGWIQYFYTSTWIWTLCYAIDMRLILKEREERLWSYHLVAWIIPALLTLAGSLIFVYYHDTDGDERLNSYNAIVQNLPNYLAIYIPIVTVMVANPALYVKSSRDMERIITCTSGQFTKREREIMDSIKIKFSAINIVFYTCWFPNLINGLLLWLMWYDLPFATITVTYMMAFVNPLQAFLNCLVYRRWNSDCEVVLLPWVRNNNNIVEVSRSDKSTQNSSESRQMSIPLLQKYRGEQHKTYS